MRRKPPAPPDLASISLSPLDISSHFTRKWAGTDYAVPLSQTTCRRDRLREVDIPKPMVPKEVADPHRLLTKPRTEARRELLGGTST